MTMRQTGHYGVLKMLNINTIKHCFHLDFFGFNEYL
jgi:hypothetical protein